MVNEEANLKKVLGLKDAIGIAIGQIIGAGIMSITGIAIGLTGTGVPLAFLLSSIFMLIITIPLAVLGSVLPTTGGMYISIQVGCYLRTRVLFICSYSHSVI